MTRDIYVFLNISLICCTNARFTGDWNPEIAEHDLSTAISGSGYFTTHSGFPLMQCSKCVTETALFTIQSRHVLLIKALCVVVPIMRLYSKM